MIAPRFRKAFRDLTHAPVRTALCVLAMAAGVFGIGMCLTRSTILDRELAQTYADTRPASAILVGSGLDDAIVSSIRSVPGVIDAELRPMIGARVRVGDDEWAPLILFVIRDFNDIRLDRFVPDEGTWPPGDDEILIERSALSVARAGIGDSITMRTADGGDRELRVAGTVHAAGLAPGWMDHMVSGFVTWNSIARGDRKTESGRLRLVTTGTTEKQIREVAGRVRVALESRGAKVTRVEVPAPGRHPHADQMDTFLFLLSAFAALTFLLSSLLVANTIHTLLSEQMRQIGVMKAIGATDSQVGSIYLVQVAILATLALGIGMPAGYAAGAAYARFAAGILNATIVSARVPAWAIAFQIAIGLGVPLLVALGPIRQASRLPIHTALGNNVTGKSFGSRPFDLWLARIPALPRPLMLSVRTLFHRRGRLILTAGMLGAGGAAFLAALNTGAAWDRGLEEDAGARRYDVAARLSKSYSTTAVDAVVRGTNGIVRAEYWPESSAFFRNDAAGIDDVVVAVIAPDPNTPILRLPVLEGRWLSGERDTAVVITQTLAARDPSLRVGGPIALRFGDRQVVWKIAGIVKELVPHLAVYAAPRALFGTTSLEPGTTRTIRAVTTRHDAEGQLAAARELERALQATGIGVLQIQSLSDNRQAVADHLVIIKSALVSAAALVVLIGALGLTSNLMVSVIERTREIGVLSAIGATPRGISRIVVVEGVLVALLSWCVAVIASLPATAGVGALAGRMFLKTGLDFVISPAALGIWLLLVVVISAIASSYPAWRASRLTVREAIAYE